MDDRMDTVDYWIGILFYIVIFCVSMVRIGTNMGILCGDRVMVHYGFMFLLHGLGNATHRRF